ncbi:site-2 protease family protein [Candidatus Campbellbacteria bacterium]|nr:site-2 protease family protein [Candidatus Campbellbacteria bacterium]|tara:strand:- start:21046 stop:21642 length:597 start_codon:yes stop_codon:yes gene_type:complete
MQDILFVVILIISVVFHEVAHGYTADKLGDPTARIAGRLTLNPLVHLDWFGSVILPALLIISGAPFILGWAKPVPFNPHYFKNPRWDAVKVAVAGPLTNIGIAILAVLVLSLASMGPLGTSFLQLTVVMNVALAIFNLLPIPPLDGHHVLFALIPEQYRHIKESLRRYAFPILIAFLFIGLDIIEPVIFGISNFLLSL